MYLDIYCDTHQEVANTGNAVPLKTHQDNHGNDVHLAEPKHPYCYATNHALLSAPASEAKRTRQPIGQTMNYLLLSRPGEQHRRDVLVSVQDAPVAP